MGLLKSGKKVAKFSFVSMPMSILGIHSIRMGNAQIRDLWKSISYPVCPQCEKGTMVLHGDSPEDREISEDGKIFYPWICNCCSFSFLEENDVAKVRAGVMRLRNERISAELQTMDDTEQMAEREYHAKKHRRDSWIFLAGSSLVALGAVYNLAVGSPIFTVINWCAIAFMLSAFAIKKAYRSWQAKTGTLFVPGSFWHWFKHERWFL